MLKKNYLLALLISVSTFVKSQEISQSFRPVLYASLVGSQVDGDTYAGYNKPGFMVGAGINRQFSRLIELEFGLTFIQKGARHNYSLDSASRNNPANPFYLSRLNYLEIPVTLKFNYKKFKAEIGAAAAYLINNPPNIQTNNPVVNDFQYKSLDFSSLVGLAYKLKPNLLVNVRLEYSILAIRPYYTSTAGIYHGQFPYSLFNRGLYNNVLQLGLHYILPSKSGNGTPPVNGK